MDIFSPEWRHAVWVPGTSADRSWDAFVREFGVNLSRARTAAGLSQQRVAQRAGIAANTYRQYEKGESKPGTPANMGFRNVLALSQALGVPLTDLMPDPLPDLTDGR
jgi:transcriptional regulator with XRE-family HTH domain